MIFLFLGAICCLTGAMFILVRKIRSLQKSHIVATPIPRKNIAILAPNITAVSNLFTKGFISQLKKYASFEFDIIECDSKSDTQQNSRWAEYIMEQKPDLILTMGRVCTETMMRVMATRRERIPIVSAGIPIEMLDEEPKNLQKELPVTGAITSFRWEEKITLLKKTFPHLKNVLVLFRSIEDISRINLKEKNCIMAALRKQHINAKMHHIANINRSLEMSRELLNDIDLVIISRSSSLMTYAEKISQELASYGVPTFSTDKETSDKVFVTISSNIEERIGERCAKQAMKILEDGVHPSKIAIPQLSSKEVVSINLSLNFSREKSLLAKTVSILPASATIQIK